MSATTKTRLCPFRDCTRRIDPGYFACGRHWNSLSSIQRVDIYAAYEAWQRGQIDGDEVRRRQQIVLGDRGNASNGDS